MCHQMSADFVCMCIVCNVWHIQQRWSHLKKKTKIHQKFNNTKVKQEQHTNKNKNKDITYK